MDNFIAILSVFVWIGSLAASIYYASDKIISVIFGIIACCSALISGVLVGNLVNNLKREREKHG